MRLLMPNAPHAVRSAVRLSQSTQTSWGQVLWMYVSPRAGGPQVL